MASIVEVLVPVRRRWAAGRWQTPPTAVETRDLRLLVAMAGAGLVVWGLIGWLAWALLA